MGFFHDIARDARMPVAPSSAPTTFVGGGLTRSSEGLGMSAGVSQLEAMPPPESLQSGKGLALSSKDSGEREASKTALATQSAPEMSDRVEPLAQETEAKAPYTPEQKIEQAETAPMHKVERKTKITVAREEDAAEATLATYLGTEATSEVMRHSDPAVPNGLPERKAEVQPRREMLPEAERIGSDVFEGLAKMADSMHGGSETEADSGGTIERQQLIRTPEATLNVRSVTHTGPVEPLQERAPEKVEEPVVATVRQAEKWLVDGKVANAGSKQPQQKQQQSVKIGRIDVVIEAPEAQKPAAASQLQGNSSGFASRHYLRGV